MERDFPSVNLNTWMTLKKLENATREEFERYAQFILLLIHVQGRTLSKKLCDFFTRMKGMGKD